MFFKNALIYRITQNIDLSGLEEALAGRVARPCGEHEFSATGFIAPIGKGDDAPLVHEGGGFKLIKLHKEERIIPASAIRDALNEKVEQIEARDGRKVYKKERDTLKDDVIAQMLPHAFIRKSSTSALFMPGFVVVDASTASKAEDLLSLVRECNGTLPVRPLCVRVHPSVGLTQWVKEGEIPGLLWIGDACELRDGDGGVIRCKSQDLSSDEIQAHLSAGLSVTGLSVGYDHKLTFALDTNLHIKRIKFDDILRVETSDAETLEEEQDASFAINAGTLAELIPVLIEALGGEEVPEGLGDDAASDKADDTHLIAQAIESQRGHETASIARIQRVLMVGYNRAARLMEELERRGAVSAPDESGQRKVIEG